MIFSLRAAGKTDTDALVIAMASAQGRTVKVITEDPAGGYFRSDHFNFVKKRRTYDFSWWR